MGHDNPEGAGAGERLSALVALLGMAAAVVVVAVAAAANWQGLVITLIGLLLIVPSGWYVVSRRGVVRSAAALVALAGVGLLIAGFIVADLSVLTWVTVVVLAALSVAAARYALRKGTSAMSDRAESRTAVSETESPAA